MPVSRSVRTSVSRPTPRAASRGRTSFAHIGRISRGGPGSVTMTRPSGRSTHQPGAVPWGFARIRAEGSVHACFVLVAGNGWRRRAHSPCSHSSVAGSTTGRSPHASATASRVRSSGVGPRPPVVTTRSARPSAARSASTTVARSSGRFEIRTTVTPRATIDRASSPLLVSVVSPTVSSVPIASSSAVTSARPAPAAAG